MEVMQGQYKDTKIGRIPKDWNVAMIKDVCKVVTSGFSFDVFEKSKLDIGTEVLFTKVSDMNLKGNERIITDSVNKGFFADDFVKSNSVLKPNSLIFPKRGAAIKTNKKRINGKHIILDPNLIAVSFGENCRANYLFIYYYFISFDLMRIVEDGTIPQLNKRDIEPFKIPLPPFEEQQKIAEILSTVDEQISTTQAIIDKSKELKKGLMQKLFSEGIGHTEFKETKIGRIPKDWEVVKLGNHSSLIMGQAPSGKDCNKKGIGYVFVKAGQFGKPYPKIEEWTTNPLKKVNSQYILICVVGATIGKLNLGIECAIGRSVAGIKTNDDLSLKFLYNFLFTRIKNFRNGAQGAAQGVITKDDINNLQIPLPPFEEQQKIAEILSEADAKIEKEENEKVKLEELKKGLMQQLLTGKKRVKV